MKLPEKKKSPAEFGDDAGPSVSSLHNRLERKVNSENPLFVDLPRLREALKKYNATKTDIAVMEDIAQWANRYGRAFPTEKAIAARHGLRRKAVSRSVDWAAAHGFMTIKREKRGQDKHPRNNYYIAKLFRLSRPDKQSEHFKASKWQRWCEIGKKRFYNAQKRKQAAQAAAGTIRDTAARMAGGKRPTTASASQLTPAQARDARQKRGGGFAGFGGVLAGLFPTASSTPAAPVVKDTYAADLKQRGDMLQALREHEAAAAMASQPTQAEPTAPAPAPAATGPAIRTASEQRDGMARANAELQQLREKLRQQAAPTTGTATAARMAARDVARDYSRASKRAAYPSDPWPSSTRDVVQPIRQPQAPADMQQEAQAAWRKGLQATKWQAARDVRNMASQRAAYSGIVTR